MKRKSDVKVFCLVLMLSLVFAFQSVAIASDPININTATVKELVKLKGIGRIIAERIIQYRQENGEFKTVKDLLNVKGIGPKILEANKGKIVV